MRVGESHGGGEKGHVSGGGKEPGHVTTGEAGTPAPGSCRGREEKRGDQETGGEKEEGEGGL